MESRASYIYFLNLSFAVTLKHFIASPLCHIKQSPLHNFSVITLTRVVWRFPQHHQLGWTLDPLLLPAGRPLTSPSPLLLGNPLGLSPEILPPPFPWTNHSRKLGTANSLMIPLRCKSLKNSFTGFRNSGLSFSGTFSKALSLKCSHQRSQLCVPASPQQAPCSKLKTTSGCKGMKRSLFFE